MITGQTWLGRVRGRLFDARRAKRRIGPARRRGVVQSHVAMIERLEPRVLLSATVIDNIETSNLPSVPNCAATPVITTLTLPDADSVNLPGATIPTTGCQTGDGLSFPNTQTLIGNFVNNVLSQTDTVTCDGISNIVTAIGAHGSIGDGIRETLTALENAEHKLISGGPTDVVSCPHSQFSDCLTSSEPAGAYQAASSMTSPSPTTAHNPASGFSWDSLHIDGSNGTDGCNVDLGEKITEFWQNLIAERDQLRTELKSFLETSLHDALQNTVIDDLFQKIEQWL